MLIEQVKKLNVTDRWLYWIKERESIRIKKESRKPKPWTDDEILQNYRFCNVRRMDDKVSQWLLRNWYTPHFNHPNMVRAVALARFVNLPDSLEVITSTVFSKYWKASKIVELLRGRKEDGNTIFNGAYMVRGNDGMDKIDCVVNYYVASISSNVSFDSMEQCVRGIESCYGYGSFMAGQIAADLRWAVEGKWGDKNTWAAIGPGSKKGMNVFHGREPKYNLGQEAFTEELTNAIRLAKRRLPKRITRRLEAIDYQNTFCEFWKYERTLRGIGKPKSRYLGVQHGYQI